MNEPYDTLFVISSAGGPYVLNDLIRSLTWSCQERSHFIVAVDETGQVRRDSLVDDPDRVKLLSVDFEDSPTSGFYRGAGLRWAVQKGLQFQQAVLMDSTCLVMGQALDGFLLQHTSKEGVGLLGVRDTHHSHVYDTVWKKSINLFYEWSLPHEQCEQPPPVLMDAVLALSQAFVQKLTPEWMVPDDCHRWTSSYAAYLSWICRMVNLYTISWGYSDRVLPPLYVARAPAMYLPSPTVLSPRFLLYSAVNQVMGYSEGDLRELFKKERGEAAREIPSFGPAVTGPGAVGG